MTSPRVERFHGNNVFPDHRVSRSFIARSSLGASILLLATQLCVALPDSSGPDEPSTPAIRTVEVTLFYQPGCDECASVTNHVLPLISAQFGRTVRIVELAVDVASNRMAMLDAINRAGDTSNERVYIDVNHRHLLAGAEAIERDLAATINMALSEPPPTAKDGDTGGVRMIADRFTVPSVILYGLVDSINPCAIAALIFLISVLTLARERPINVLAAGLAYCLGVFVTYTAIGFGLLQALRTLDAFPAVRRAFDVFLCVLLAVMSVLSFRDAARARAGTPEGMSLRLPDSLSALVRATLRNRFGAAVGLSSAFLAGCVVTAIETVCTGQVYAPTLAIVVAHGGSTWRDTALLLLYNLMFVLPLLVILVLTWRGMAVSRLLAWSTRNAVIAKTSMGFLFLGLLAFLVILRLRWW